jgi:autophagy-related protein 2
VRAKRDTMGGLRLTSHARLLVCSSLCALPLQDIIHSSMPHVLASSIEVWRPDDTLVLFSDSETLSTYHARVMTAARTAARMRLKAMDATAMREVDSAVYIQSFSVSHKILLCIDWKPNTFDLAGLQGGDWAQLAHLLPLENMELELKAVQMVGLSGFGRVGVELAKLWAYDLSRHQAHRYLAGVQPIRSIVNVGAGVADLILLPVSHYAHHGNLKRGMQRGLSSFLRNVSLESMAAAARLAQGAQTVLESVDDALTFAPTPLPQHAQSQFAQQRARGATRRGNSTDVHSASSSGPEHARRKGTTISKQANPPSSAQDGFRQAYDSLSRGLQSAATQMIVLPRSEYQRYGSRGAMKTALKGVPSAVLSPIIGGMEAVAKVLNGITNSMDPKRKKENLEKFKS